LGRTIANKAGLGYLSREQVCHPRDADWEHSEDSEWSSDSDDDMWDDDGNMIPDEEEEGEEK
jgi:hypothetical protein